MRREFHAPFKPLIDRPRWHSLSIYLHLIKGPSHRENPREIKAFYCCQRGDRIGLVELMCRMRTFLLVGLILALASSSADARRRHHHGGAYIDAPQDLPETTPLRARDPRPRLPQAEQTARDEQERLIPSGWRLQPPDPDWHGRRYVSPIGDAWLATYESPVTQEPLSQHLKAVAFAEGEEITYLLCAASVTGSSYPASRATASFTARSLSLATSGRGSTLRLNIRLKRSARSTGLSCVLPASSHGNATSVANDRRFWRRGDSGWTSSTKTRLVRLIVVSRVRESHVLS